MKRDLTVDVARGIGMILVVAGHSRINELMGGYAERWIFSFHMPLFFLLAGYCFNEARYPNWFGYVKRKVLAIWWPFVALSLFIAVVSVGLYWGKDPSMSFANQCQALLTLDTRIAPFWFLPVLFAVEVAYWLVRRLPRWAEYAVLLACLVVGGFCFDANHTYHDVTFLVAMVWYGVGKGLRDCGAPGGRALPHGTGHEPRRTRREPRAWSLLAVAAVCFVVHGVGVWYGLNGVVSYAGGKWINPWVHFPTCLLALLGVLLLAKALALAELQLRTPTKILSWIGMNSMAILAVHAFPGIYRRTWISAWGMNAALSYVLEALVFAAMLWLLVRPLKGLVRVENCWIV